MDGTAAPSFPRELPGPLRAQGEALLHLQCWLWGQDIRRPAGNLLVQYGFTRVPCPIRRASRYDLAWPAAEGPVERLSLWGYGVHLRARSGAGIYIGRYGFLPQVATVAPEDAWWPDELGPRLPGSPEEYAGIEASIDRLAAWAAEYEEWAEAEAPGFRETSLAALPANFARQGGLRTAMVWRSFHQQWRAFTCAAPPGAANLKRTPTLE